MATRPAGRESGWRQRVWHIIFGTDTPAGKAFDVGLLWLILLSVLAVALETVVEIRTAVGHWLRVFEWVVTIAFTLEYLLRLACVRKPANYAFSFFGIVDLIAIMPTYLSLVLPGTQSFIVVRALRLLRVFRVFKLARYLGEANVLMTALRSSTRKVIVFLQTVLIVVVIMAAAMYLIEGDEAGFTSIPRSMYWAIVTMTTVGYGDIAPQTVLGQTLAAILMIMGYSIIAVPTGIVSAEMVHVSRTGVHRECVRCAKTGHDADARFCKDCGGELATPAH